jgi:hypothetical protein
MTVQCIADDHTEYQSPWAGSQLTVLIIEMPLQGVKLPGPPIHP